MKTKSIDEFQNKIILGKVTKITKFHFEIITPNKEIGTVYISDVSDYYIDDLKNIVKIGSILYLVVKKIENNKLVCSFKENRTDFLRTPFEYNIHQSETKDFQNLYNFTNEEIEKWKESK